jgi:Transglycosylase SLT domain
MTSTHVPELAASAPVMMGQRFFSDDAARPDGFELERPRTRLGRPGVVRATDPRACRIIAMSLAIILFTSLAHAQPRQTPRATSDPGSSVALCTNAIHAAELQHHLPAGLLLAISQVESGRPDPVTNRLEPWPWTVQVGKKSLFFDSKSQAVQWVTAAMAHGVTSIDTGCLQVNLFFHPHVFATLDDAFDPPRNADYAARFLQQLYAAAGNWQRAIGLYHSRTLAFARPYEARVDRMRGGTVLARTMPLKRPTLLNKLATAWRATLPSEELGSEYSTGNDMPPKPPTLLRQLAAAWQATMPQPGQ